MLPSCLCCSVALLGGSVGDMDTKDYDHRMEDNEAISVAMVSLDPLS